MKNSLKSADNNFNLISVVVPKVNGMYAKLLVLTDEVYSKIKKLSESNKGTDSEMFALYAESNLHHEVSSEMGALTITQFDELLKEIYNAKKQLGRGGKYLKSIQ
ncbi:hypothetical protein [Flavobacterium ovatum]|uniref:hypothetical protein n=1 Tax=Flavobacterium ovatum TaxID=1928857 RepID=UPI00344DF841